MSVHARLGSVALGLTLCLIAGLGAPVAPVEAQSDRQANAWRPLTHEELLAIRGERDRYHTWGRTTLVAEAVIEREAPLRGPAERGQEGFGFGTLPRGDAHPGDPVVMASQEVAAMIPADGTIAGQLLAFSDERWSGMRVEGPVATPAGTYLTPITPAAMAVADELPAASQILVRGWFTLLTGDEPCPQVPPGLDPQDDGGWGSPFVRCPAGWLTANQVSEPGAADPSQPTAFGIPVQQGAIEQFDRDDEGIGTRPITYLLRRVANPIDGAEPSLGWKVVGLVGPRAIPSVGPPQGSTSVLRPEGLDWQPGLQRQPPADQWQIDSTAWAGGFASLRVGADRVLSAWVSADGRDWQGTELPTAVRSVAALLRLGGGLVIIANQEAFDDVWRWETWSSDDGLEWRRTSRQRVSMPARFSDGRRVVQGWWSLGDRVVSLATYTSTPCCGRSGGWLAVAAQEQEPQRDSVFAWVTQDGRSWTRQHTTGIPQGGETHFGNLVADAGGELLANKGGSHRELLRSRDGIRWRAIGQLPTEIDTTSPVLFDRNERGLVLVGQVEVEGRNRYRMTYWHSTDGRVWRPTLARFGGRPVDVASSGDVVVIAGNDGYSRSSGVEHPWLTVSTDGGRTWDESLGWVGETELCLESIVARGPAFSLDARCAPPDGASSYVTTLPARDSFREGLMDRIRHGTGAAP